jgi:hypothetical protein
MASVRFPADAANRCAPSRVLWTAVAEDPARRLRLTCKSPISGPASQRARGFFLLRLREGLEESRGCAALRLRIKSLARRKRQHCRLE